MKMKSKQGQMSISDAPTIVLMVGLVFLVMATVALVSDKYNDAFPSSISATTTGEALTQAELVAGSALDGAGSENAESLSVTSVTNGTGGIVIDAGNFTVNGFVISNDTSEFTTQDWIVNYTYKHAGVSANVTTSLTTEISNNTSIAGIILTISLVGIVLTILIGIFAGVRSRRL